MTNCKLEAIYPDSLRYIWPKIRSEAFEIKVPDDKLPEDIYAHCLYGESVLFILSKDDERIGWMVIRKVESSLHIWQLYSKERIDVFSIFREDLMSIAKTAECTKITFSTQRRGWEKVAPKHKFHVTDYINGTTYYSCDVN